MKKLPISTGQKVIIADGALTPEEFNFYGLKIDSIGKVSRTSDDVEITKDERERSSNEYVPQIFTASQKKNGWSYAVQFSNGRLPVFFKIGEIVAVDG